METNAATSVNEAVSNEFENLTDEDVILRIKSDEGRAALDYLINKYRNFVRAKARSYFLIGADREDIIQEGMIGLYKAIRDFRNHISISELRDVAYLSFNMTDGEQLKVNWNVKQNVATIFSLSNQKYSFALTLLAVLWALFSARYFQKREAQMLARHFVTIGNLSFDPERQRFLCGSKEVKFTPMQQQVMEMFFAEDSHRLNQTDICQKLWPKKDDANETLYTLIRRLKSVVHEQTDLDIEAERGKGYLLKVNQGFKGFKRIHGT